MPYGNCGWGMGGGWGMWLFGTLLLVGLVLLILVAVRLMLRGTPGRDSYPGDRTAPHLPAPAGQSRARQILEERYARGEIDSEEYLERRRTLDGAE